MRELHCPACGAPFVRVTYQEGRVERLLSRVNVFPFRCQLCTNRFRAFYSGARHNTQAFDRRQYTRLRASIEAQVLDRDQPVVINRITDISRDGCTPQTTGFPKGAFIELVLKPTVEEETIPIDDGRTEQTIAVSIRIVSSSTVGFKTNSIKAPFENPVVCRAQPSIEISVIWLVSGSGLWSKTRASMEALRRAY